MAATAWATVVFAFGLQCFRLHSVGERFTFDFDGEPGFTDFISLALTVSSAGFYAGAAPTTCPGVRTLRSHTVTEKVQLAPEVDCVQADANRCGGVTKRSRVAAATVNQQHLEWFHDHVRNGNVI